MKNLNFLSNIIVVVSLSLLVSACGKLGKSKSLPNDGQLHGVSLGFKYTLPKPPGMVYVPQGTFHMGPSDEDISYAITSRNRQVSIIGFWMDATEITNNEYRQFVWYVRDSTAAFHLGLKKSDTTKINWADVKAKLKWNDPNVVRQLEDKMIVTPENRIGNRKVLDVNKLIYITEFFDYKTAAQRENIGKPRSLFIIRDTVPVYPDTLVWIRDYTYAFNEPMKIYFSHPAFENYPVVGVNWRQASAFCNWRTIYLNSYLESKKRLTESDFRLPTEAEWEYAARGGRSQTPYPWGGPYTRNKKGCLLANFKPGRGNYPEDGGFYTVRADAYWPNDFGLYNMAGNVSEWTSSLYNEGAYGFQHDMNPDVRWNVKGGELLGMKRKVIRGGSWKDIAYYLQNGTRNYEYLDTAKSYIGFRCVIDLPPMPVK